MIRCNGKGCPIKEKCLRTKRKEGLSIFTKEPFVINNGKFECDMFWGEASDYLLAELTSIVDGKR